MVMYYLVVLSKGKVTLLKDMKLMAVPYTAGGMLLSVVQMEPASPKVLFKISDART